MTGGSKRFADQPDDLVGAFHHMAVTVDKSVRHLLSSSNCSVIHNEADCALSIANFQIQYLDASDVWEAIDHIDKHKVPQSARENMLDTNARRFSSINARLVLTKAPQEYQAETMLRYA